MYQGSLKFAHWTAPSCYHLGMRLSLLTPAFALGLLACTAQVAQPAAPDVSAPPEPDLAACQPNPTGHSAFDAYHCGGCGPCPVIQSDLGPYRLGCCWGACVDLRRDRKNCAACDRPCAALQRCDNGVCN